MDLESDLIAEGNPADSVSGDHALGPVHQRILANIRSSTKLFVDETMAPAFDPGTGAPRNDSRRHVAPMS
jgi:hypothetical protein